MQAGAAGRPQHQVGSGAHAEGASLWKQTDRRRSTVSGRRNDHRLRRAVSGRSAGSAKRVAVGRSISDGARFRSSSQPAHSSGSISTVPSRKTSRSCARSSRSILWRSRTRSSSISGRRSTTTTTSCSSSPTARQPTGTGWSRFIASTRAALIAALQDRRRPGRKLLPDPRRFRQPDR